jgi:hypothetical protein
MLWFCYQFIREYFALILKRQDIAAFFHSVALELSTFSYFQRCRELS